MAVRNRFRAWLAIWLQDRRRVRAAGLQMAPAPPNAPTGLVLADVSNWIELTWQDNSNNELGFRVYRKVDAGSSSLWQTLGSVVTTQDLSVVPGHYYEYYVTAYNASGESSPSNTVAETYGT